MLFELKSQGHRGVGEALDWEAEDAGSKFTAKC